MCTSALRRIVLASALVLVSAIVISLAGRDSANASHIPGVPQFAPSFDVKLCNTLPATFTSGITGAPAYLNGGGPTCTPNTTPSGNPNLGTSFSVAGGSHNFGGELATYLRDFTLNTAIPQGTIMGGLRSTVTLGVLTGTCNNTLTPKFVFFAAEDDYSDVFAVDLEGTVDRFKTLVQDAGGDADDQLVTGVAGSDGMGDPDAQGVTMVPDTVLRYLDPDGDGIDTDSNPATVKDQPIQYLARYFGATQVTGQWQTVSIMVFAPGVIKAAFSGNTGTTLNLLASLDSGLGNVTLSALNDPTASVLSVNPISDFCSPLGIEATLLGTVDTDGDGTRETVRLTSPASTSHLAGVQTMSLRDQDKDGLENALDSCPYIANMEDPYSSLGPDADMLDSACDPTPATDTGLGDHDGDGYLNSQDICPLVDPPPPGTSGAETENEGNVTYNAAAPAGGPRGDAIGDGCDAAISVANGGWFRVTHTDSVCITSGLNVDMDGDGWCTDGGAISIGEDTNDSDAAVPTNTTVVYVPGSDHDVDSFQSENEVKIGTDPGWPCSLISGHDAWPRDFDYNRVVNITDLVQLLPPYFGAAAGSANFTMRRNLDTSNNVINITDLVQLLPPYFGSSCVSPQIRCEINILASTINNSRCLGGTIVGTVGATITATFAGACLADAGNDTTAVFAKIDATAPDTVDTGKAKCTTGTSPPIADLANAPAPNPPFGPVNSDTDLRTGRGSGDFECTFKVTDAVALGNTSAQFICWGFFVP